MKLERAEVVSFDPLTYTATVRYAASLSTSQAGIPVAGHLAAGLLPAGTPVAVLVFDEFIAGDRVIIGPYGGVPAAWLTSGMLVAGAVTDAAIAPGIDAGKLDWSTNPACRVYHSTSQTLPNNLSTALQFDSERYDSDSIHSAAAPTRLTCATAGFYLIFANVRFAASTGGERVLLLRLNGGNYIGNNYANALLTGYARDINVMTGYPLAVGDYVEVEAYQNSGGSLAIDANGNYSPEFGMVRVG